MRDLPARAIGPGVRSPFIGRAGGAVVNLPHLQNRLSEREKAVVGLQSRHLSLIVDEPLRIRPDVVKQLGDAGHLHGMTPDGSEIVVQVAERLRATLRQRWG